MNSSNNGSSQVLLDYGVRSRPVKGEVETGDLHLVLDTADGVLLAVVDGAGHGVEAAQAAKLAIDTLTRHSNEGVIPLMQHCHERLKGTRGAVITLISIRARENTITWLGIGNIEAVLLGAGKAGESGNDVLFLRPGMVGYRLPRLQAVVTPIAPYDLLIAYTDGIRADFPRDFSPDSTPDAIAEYILSTSGRDNDDGLVLVARYLGPRV